MKIPYLEQEIKVLEQGLKDKTNSFYQNRKLSEYREIKKQLLLHNVVGQSEQFTLEQMRQAFDAGAWEHHLHTFDSWLKTLK